MLILFTAAVVLEDTAVTTATDQSIRCSISGLSQNTPVTWIDPDDNEISDSDSSNYEIDQGLFGIGFKTSELTIKAAKLAVLTSDSVYKCKLKSSLYPVNSPDVVKEMRLTLLDFGKYLGPFM